MPVIRRRPKLPATSATELTAACDLAQVESHPLAVALGPLGAAVTALRTHVAYRTTQGTPWTLVAWHQVLRGSWNAETNTLELDQQGTVDRDLVRPGGRRHRVRLHDPARVPEVMSERVAATILFQRDVPVPDSRGTLTVTARRSLADQTVTWLALAGRGVRVSDPQVGDFASAAVRRLRFEFG